MGFEDDSLEIEKRIALVLGVAIGTLSEPTSDELSRLYKRLYLGGGIFRGSPMTEELAKATRYELLPYLAALAAALVQDWPKRTIPCEGILGQLEKAMFSFNLERAKPTYAYYLARYYFPPHSDSVLLTPETIIHSEFLQRLAKIWSIFQNSTDARTSEYAQAISNLTRQNELSLRNVLAGIWPETTQKVQEHPGRFMVRYGDTGESQFVTSPTGSEKFATYNEAVEFARKVAGETHVQAVIFDMVERGKAPMTGRPCEVMYFVSPSGEITRQN